MPNDYAVVDETALFNFQRTRNAFREQQVAACAALWSDVKSGRVPSYVLKEAIQPRTPSMMRHIQMNYPGILRISEAMTTSDFTFLSVDVFDRMTLARFRSYPSAWRQFVRVTSVSDMRSVRRDSVDGLDGRWPDIPEQTEITYGSLAEGAPLTYAPRKYGLAAKMSWEAVLNDDLNVFDTIPDRLGIGGAFDADVQRWRSQFRHLERRRHPLDCREQASGLCLRRLRGGGR